MARFAAGTISKPTSLVVICAVYVIAAMVAATTGWLLTGIGQHPLVVAGAADLAATIVVFCFSVLLDNSSCYDPYWSVAPPALAGYFWIGSAGSWQAALVRRTLLSTLVVVWAARLTFNWVRRWAGLADEDWRYRNIRASTGRAYWAVSLLGIHLMPTVLVFAGCLPLYVALSSNVGFGLLDLVATVVTATAIGIETIADRQLHRFIASRPASGSYLTTGLWGRCRHPNYLGEILFWWGLALFAPAASGLSGSWTMVGAAAITVLFVFVSIPMIDRRMLERRPAYSEQIKRLPALLP